MSYGGEKHDHIMNPARQHRTDDDPERPGQITELGGQHRSQERTGSGNCGKVMAEEDIPVGLHVIMAVSHRDGGSGSLRSQIENSVCDEQSVIAVGQRENTQRNDHESQCIHALFLLECSS